LPRSRSAKKAVRKNLRRRMRNRAAKSRVRSQIKKLRALIASGNAEAAQAQLRTVCRTLDKTAQKSILKKGTADRYKSRLSRQVAALEVKK